MESSLDSSRIAVSHFSVDAVKAEPTSATNLSAVGGSIVAPLFAILANRLSTKASARFCRSSALSSLLSSVFCNGNGTTSSRGPHGVLPSAFSKARNGNESSLREDEVSSAFFTVSLILFRSDQSTRQKIASITLDGSSEKTVESSSSSDIT